MASPRTYPVEIPDVGRFVFHKRRIDDQVRIEADAQRMTGGQIDDPELVNIAMAVSVLRRLTVEAPEGWDLDEIDPLDRADTDRLWAVYGGLRDAEATFRRKA